MTTEHTPKPTIAEVVEARCPMSRVLAMVPGLLNYSVAVHIRGLVDKEIVTVCVQWGDPTARSCQMWHGETEHDCWVKALAWFEERAAKEASDAT